MSASPQEIAAAIRNVPDFPKPGIQFKDITPVLADTRLFQGAIEQLTAPYQPGDIDVVVGVDARGFIFAAAAALHLKAGFVPVRKQGKLPYDTHEESYDLEYGSNTVAIHTDAIAKGGKTLLVDDLLATGGTAAAALNLLRKLDVQLVEAAFLIELEFLKGRDLLGDIPCTFNHYLLKVTVQRSLQFTDSYDLKRTIESGQAFHWVPSEEDSWETAWRGSWVGVQQVSSSEIILKTNSVDDDALNQVADYFQCGVDVASIIRSFPDDTLMQKAIECCSGLRLLRQDPWLCLASFILSSTKQITQIKEIVRLMSRQLGRSIPCPKRDCKVYSFPEPRDIVRAGEPAVRKCKAGFRAKYIHQCALEIDSGRFDLERVRSLSLEEARKSLTSLPGVGPKIANCVLLFAYGFSRAFPIDVWVQRVLQDYYFGGDKVSQLEMGEFIDSYFGSNAGFAQQYLFDYIRSLSKSEWAAMVLESPFRK